MRVAALYDVHGNLPALDAVLPEAEHADLILVGGDAVAGPWPAETLERLRGLGERVRFVRGNADRELTSQRAGRAPLEVLEFVRERLTKAQLDFLAPWPLSVSLQVDGIGAVLFCHATPRNDDELLTRISAEDRWSEALADTVEATVVCGHTHVQFERTIGEKRLINSGSVGMPYEDEPGAYWTMLGPGVEFRRTEYTPGDLASAGWPGDWPAATADEATQFFEGLSLEHA